MSKIEHIPPSPTAEGVASVADLYIVHDAADRAQPSSAFLNASSGLSEAAQTTIKQLIEAGFENVARKAR